MNLFKISNALAPLLTFTSRRRNRRASSACLYIGEKTACLAEIVDDNGVQQIVNYSLPDLIE